MKLGTLVGRNGAQLFFCFAGSALLNVLSQSFFARAAGSDKDAWLAGTLLMGTLAATLGVPAAQRFGLPGRAGATGLALVASAGALFGGTFVLRSAAAFAAAAVALRFLMQYGTHEFDRRAVLLAGPGGRRTNDAVGLAMRFGGMLLGPLWFGLARNAPAATASVIATMTALGAWTCRLTAAAPRAVPPRGVEPLDARGRTMLAAARAIYAAYYLLASSIIYVLADLHRVQSPVQRGGILITLVYGSAIAATVAEMARGRTTRRSPLEMLPAPLLMALVGAALPFAPARSLAAQAVGCVLLGGAFARYQLAFRDHASFEAVHRNRPALLAAYNNLATTSALVGYAVMAALVAACRALGISYASVAGLGVAALGITAAPLVVASARGAELESTARAPGANPEAE